MQTYYFLYYDGTCFYSVILIILIHYCLIYIQHFNQIINVYTYVNYSQGIFDNIFQDIYLMLDCLNFFLKIPYIF